MTKTTTAIAYRSDRQYSRPIDGQVFAYAAYGVLRERGYSHDAAFYMLAHSHADNLAEDVWHSVTTLEAAVDEIEALHPEERIALTVVAR